jgi:hypothetical protein
MSIYPPKIVSAYILTRPTYLVKVVSTDLSIEMEASDVYDPGSPR